MFFKLRFLFFCNLDLRPLKHGFSDLTPLKHGFSDSTDRPRFRRAARPRPPLSLRAARVTTVIQDPNQDKPENPCTTATGKLLRPSVFLKKSSLWVKKLRRPAFEFRHIAASVDARGNVTAMCFEFPLLHPWKRRKTERSPEAGVRGASPGVWVRRTGGGMYAYTEGALSPIAILPVCLSFTARASLGRTGAKPPRVDLGLGVGCAITPSTAQNTVLYSLYHLGHLGPTWVYLFSHRGFSSAHGQDYGRDYAKKDFPHFSPPQWQSGHPPALHIPRPNLHVAPPARQRQERPPDRRRWLPRGEGSPIHLLSVCLVTF